MSPKSWIESLVPEDNHAEAIGVFHTSGGSKKKGLHDGHIFGPYPNEDIARAAQLEWNCECDRYITQLFVPPGMVIIGLSGDPQDYVLPNPGMMRVKRLVLRALTKMLPPVLTAIDQLIDGRIKSLDFGAQLVSRREGDEEPGDEEEKPRVH